MAEILEYITANYTWFLGGAIIILLAIIGSYADKTNFGQGKKNIEKTEEQEMAKLENKRLSEYINSDSTEKEKTNLDINDNNNKNISPDNSVIDSTEKIKNLGDNDNLVSDNKIKKSELELNINDILSDTASKANYISNEEKNEDNSFEESYNKLDEEFNAILPKKEVIEDDMLEDIENLSLDKTQKFNLNDIPDLDDVELPEINKLGKSEKNIWKF